ncbi:MAG: YlxR family protein [Propionibacteriaceae bacterium]|nr:YlxR family protein [Propionibacteriaceae bacterium]
MSAPIRTCVGCRTCAPQSDLIRLAWDGCTVVISRTASGRGAWLHPEQACLDQANRRRTITRALRITSSAPTPTHL